MAAPSVLLVNNHASAETSPGQLAGLREMQSTGELGDVDVVYAAGRPGETQQQTDQRVASQISRSRCDLVLVLSMKSRVQDMAGISRALSGRQVLYWEGDPWGPGKPISEQMQAWLQLADWTFSVGGPPQWGLLRDAGAKRLRLTIHTYDHVLFAAAENGRTVAAERAVAFLGSNLMRVPLASGLPGSWQRFALVRTLRQRLGDDLLVGGPGWPRGWSVGRVPFGQQHLFIARALVMANWDHYPTTSAYTSDRLAIAMISGRPQVTTRHPQMQWLPGPDHGLYLEDDPAAVADRVRQVLLSGQARDRGVAAHEWARHRLSHREAMRHMLSCVLPEVAPPPSDPWHRLPVWP